MGEADPFKLFVMYLFGSVNWKLNSNISDNLYNYMSPQQVSFQQ